MVRKDFSALQFYICVFSIVVSVCSVLPRIEKGTVLLEEEGHLCSRNYILRALSRAEFFSEGALHKV